MDPSRITELANLLRNNGDKILNSEFTLTLSGSLLRALNDSFTLIADTAEMGAAETFQVVKPNNLKSPVFRELQLIHDFVQKTTLLRIVHYAGDDYSEGKIDLNKFHALKRLEVQKTNVKQIVGIQPLRAQLEQLICVKSLVNVDDIITKCGGDNANGFVWNELKVADFSFNNLKTVDSALEFAQYLQHLNLRQNQLQSVEAIKWLPHLKTLDLSFNRLCYVPQFHMEACKRLESLNMSNNFVEDLMGVAKLDAITNLDLSDNCLMDHACLLPLSALMTLQCLNIYGNPLHCHPKHRLATAQFLHKNCATVKFILDFEPLTKNEKAIMGTQQMRHVGSLNRYITRSSSVSINTSGHPTPSTRTPASSIGSLRSFKFQEDEPHTAVAIENTSKKRGLKKRTVDIVDTLAETPKTADIVMPTHLKENGSKQPTSAKALTKSLLVESNVEHLEAKKQIETLREKFGAEWLQAGNTEMIHSVLGIESSTSAATNSLSERNISRQLINDYLEEFSTASVDNASTQATSNTTLFTSTPTPNNDAPFNDNNHIEANISSLKPHVQHENPNESTLYMSLTNDITRMSLANESEPTSYQSASENMQTTTTDNSQNNEETFAAHIDKTVNEDEHDDDEPVHLRNVYSTAATEEPEISDAEDDEKTYIVYTTKSNEALFLTISANFLREKNALTQRTKTKWSLKILESCDRIKSNTLRINFDTLRTDKQERIYTVEDGLCQELENKLRDILSQRDLSEMNQTMYRCVNCTCQFSRENKYIALKQEVRCPDCKSTFVAEIHDIPKPLEQSSAATISEEMKLSPAAIVEESPITIPLIVKRNESVEQTTASATDDNISIGPSRLTAINTHKSRSLMQSLKSSANSLNESSSCSKITNSQSSFDSNQSAVGSSNTDRENEFKSNCESDVDILSNPSQSSIEVLDQAHNASRKTSEERRISQIPNLATIDDHSYTQSYFDRAELSSNTEHNNTTDVVTALQISTSNETTAKLKPSPLAHFNLTESSSSGSGTDSVCTAYEQQGGGGERLLTPERKKPVSSDRNASINLLQEERAYNPGNNNSEERNKFKAEQTNGALKKVDSGISSMIGALFQSTNILMSSSKKLIDVEASANIQTGTAITPLTTTTTANTLNSACQAYKFNYTDFNDVDHRLKLYFYQTKFKEVDEHFKWLARGRLYLENTQTLCEGIVVVSTCKCYVMEAFAAEHDDVTKWLRQVISVTVDRLESIQLLPWKIGLTFELRDWGNFALLLQDILRTDSLLLYFANNSLPNQCELKYQPAEQITKRLNNAVTDEKLKMCSLLNGCEIKCDTAQRNLNVCALLTTDTHLYLTSSKFDWLAAQAAETELELCVTQFMSNLVEVERPAANVCTINFLDETQDKCELWQCTFETKENADSCLNAIGQSWEQLFGVPLLNV